MALARATWLRVRKLLHPRGVAGGNGGKDLLVVGQDGPDSNDLVLPVAQRAIPHVHLCPQHTPQTTPTQGVTVPRGGAGKERRGRLWPGSWCLTTVVLAEVGVVARAREWDT